MSTNIYEIKMPKPDGRNVLYHHLEDRGLAVVFTCVEIFTENSKMEIRVTQNPEKLQQHNQS